MKLKIPNKEVMIFSAVSIGIIACISLQCISLMRTEKSSYKAESEIAVCNTSEATTDSLGINKAIYRLCECGGKIGIYDANSDVIIDVIDIFVSTLPKKDRDALKKGIEIYSFKELSKILNDFST